MPTNSSHLSVVTTADGSNTIFNSLVGENYHSRHGALQESRHVFLQMGLQHFLEMQPEVPTSVSILEVGFGTGLNFLVTSDYCIANNITLQYTGIEAYPLSPEMICQTSYNQYFDGSLWDQFLATYPGSLLQPVDMLGAYNYHVAHTALKTFKSPKKYNVIYFDAFAAVHQPEMWDEEAIAHTISFLDKGGVFVTYAITGELKRIIKRLGLTVEKAPGAPGKREMLRAIRP